MSTLYHNKVYITVQALPMTVINEMINLGKHYILSYSIFINVKKLLITFNTFGNLSLKA